MVSQAEQLFKIRLKNSEKIIRVETKDETSEIQPIEKQVVNLVHEERKILPKLGVKKLYFLLKEKITSIGKFGRDKLFKPLKINDLLVKRKRKSNGASYQTHSFHKMKLFFNKKTNNLFSDRT